MAAVGSIIETDETYRSVKKISLAWTSNASGAVSGIPSADADGELLAVDFIPGTGGVEPSNDYAVTLVDADGFDVLAGLGASLSDSTPSRVTPLLGNGTVTDQRVPLAGPLTLNVSGAGNAKQGTVTIYYR